MLGDPFETPTPVEPLDPELRALLRPKLVELGDLSLSPEEKAAIPLPTLLVEEDMSDHFMAVRYTEKGEGEICHYVRVESLPPELAAQVLAALK